MNSESLFLMKFSVYNTLAKVNKKQKKCSKIVQNLIIDLLLIVIDNEQKKITITLNSEQKNNHVILVHIAWMLLQWLYISHIIVNHFKMLFLSLIKFIYLFRKICEYGW